MSSTILVVDDEPNIVELARLYLRNEGFDVEVAANGLEALEKARTLNPKLVLLDIMMPEMDGIEVCRTLRKESDIPVIMLTARGDDIDRILLGWSSAPMTTSPSRSIRARWSRG